MHNPLVIKNKRHADSSEVESDEMNLYLINHNGVMNCNSSKLIIFGFYTLSLSEVQ